VSVDLATLLRGVGSAKVPAGIAPEKVSVAEVRDDSRLVRAGDLFVSVPGVALDGTRSPADPRFVADAAARGATVLVTDGEAPAQFKGVVVTVANARQALGVIAANRFGATAALSLMAITGTNGKTTTTYLVEAILRAAGRTAGVVGTVECRSSAPGFATRPATQTTPGALSLHSLLAEMRAAGTTDVALEATSHALDQDRLAGCVFRVAALTNITQDHLDYHASMDRYFDAKAILFERLLDPARGVGVTFVDQEEGKRMRVRVAGRALGISRQERVPGADIVIAKRELGDHGLRATFETPLGPLEIASPLVGEYNLANVAIAVGMAVAAELPAEAIVSGLAGVAGVPGRLERVPNARDVLCVVDYAHTPDALERAIEALRPYVHTGGRLIVVFGCGGDRDPGKRPLMGEIAARAADLAVVTSDNPRTENPDIIVDMIVAGMTGPGARPHHRQVDRRAAIRFAAGQARAGDVLLIAGKGHEDYQIVGKTKSHFDDREEAVAAFEALP
jgi:UDP-N-acetylmuramoyl-L-alanyl-D-glutamate--2,6-diaminopimelate ligase